MGHSRNRFRESQLFAFLIQITGVIEEAERCGWLRGGVAQHGSLADAAAFVEIQSGQHLITVPAVPAFIVPTPTSHHDVTCPSPALTFPPAPQGQTVVIATLVLLCHLELSVVA